MQICEVGPQACRHILQFHPSPDLLSLRGARTTEGGIFKFVNTEILAAWNEILDTKTIVIETCMHDSVEIVAGNGLVRWAEELTPEPRWSTLARSTKGPIHILYTTEFDFVPACPKVALVEAPAMCDQNINEWNKSLQKCSQCIHNTRSRDNICQWPNWWNRACATCLLVQSCRGYRPFRAPVGFQSNNH